MKYLKKLSVLLIASGVILICISFGYKEYCKQITKQKYEAMLNQITNKSDVEEKENEKITGLGIIEIKSLNIKAPISEGTTGDVLKFAIGHFKDTAKPGKKGNCCLAGHASNLYKANFVNLHKISDNAIIKIHTTKGTYKYKVYEKTVVKATQMDVLDATKNKELTLITCTDNGKKRFVVKAKYCK